MAGVAQSGGVGSDQYPGGFVGGFAAEIRLVGWIFINPWDCKGFAEYPGIFWLGRGGTP
jgi:hypothetical protein